MAKLLKTAETKSFTDYSETKSFTEAMENSYEWKEMATSSVTILPLENNPICVSEIRTRLRFAEEVSNETIVEAMENSKLAISLKEDPTASTKDITYPLGMTAYRQLFKREGAECSVLTNLGDSRNFKEVYPTDKAEILNTLAKYAKGKSKLLVGDEEILADLSADYVVLPFSEILEATNQYLTENTENRDFVTSQISHEFASARFDFFDSEIDAAINEAFSSIGIDVSDMRASVSIGTSNVGSQAATVYPWILDKYGIGYMIGAPIKLNHIGEGCTIEGFVDNLSKAFTSYRGIGDLIKELSSKKVNNPADTLYNIGKKTGAIPEKILREKMEAFDQEYPIFSTASDVYIGLFELLSEIPGISDIKRLQISELLLQGISRIENFDMPVLK